LTIVRDGSLSGGLPAEVSTFVGRRRELVEVHRLLSTARLVTLIGCGGVGKTRLAQRVAARHERMVRDGVWFVGLGDLRNAEVPAPELRDRHAVAQLVATAVGVQVVSARPPVDQLIRHMSSRQALLVLDNCEHVPATSQVVFELLRACPQLRILATSREPLMVDGETVFEVPPLAVPLPERVREQPPGQRSESVELFVSRAEAVAPDFRVTEANAAAVDDICARLDGLPLAIELAAVRVRVLAPAQILERLADPFSLLNRGRWAGPSRQQTLAACLDWSFELCSPVERTLWARLAVFTGSFDLSAATGVCADEVLPPSELPDVLACLMDKSVLTRVADGPVPRYRMLQPIREYGYARLRERGDGPRLRRSHKEWYEQVVTSAAADWIGPRQAHWLSRLDHEEPNLAAAFDFCLTDPDEAEAAVRMALSLPSYWWLQGRLDTGLRWVQRALAGTTAQTSARAKGLLLQALLAVWHGDLAAGAAPLAEGRALAEHLQDDVARSHARHVEGTAAMYRGELGAAVERLEQAVELLSRTPHAELDLRLNVLTGLAVATEMTGNAARAAACQREILDITEARGECCYRSRAMWRTAMAAWQAGDTHRAQELVCDAIRLRRAHGLQDWYATALCMELLAWVEARLGRHRRAASLLGAADALWTDLDFPLASRKHLADPQAECYRITRAELGEDAFDAAWRRGRGLGRADALAYALGDSPPTRRSTPEPDYAPLSRRETEVALLVAEGLKNQEVAKRLVISRRTVENHVANIMEKLGFTSRVQIAAWAVQKRRSPSHPVPPDGRQAEPTESPRRSAAADPAPRSSRRPARVSP
jgi:predicted ATPase/DNA-binding CsgD family transcriptional regulator